MSDKPTTVADWTPTGGDVVTPAAGEKTAGFQGAERPPAQYVNWFWELITQWIVWINAGYLTRASLTDDSPVMATTDQDANVKSFLDANGYNFGAVISESYWWQPDQSFAVGDLVSLGAPFYLTAEETGYTVTSSPPPADLGCNVIDIACVASPTALNGAVLSPDAAAGAGAIFSLLSDAIAVFEMHVHTEQTTASASSIYMGFHDTQGQAHNWENASYPSACMVLDYGEATFEGMTCDGTTTSKLTTGIACAINTTYHIRVEHHGANTPMGVDAGGAVTRFFVDGVLGLEKTTNQPLNTSWLGPCFGVMGLGSDTSGSVFFGPVQWAVNYVDSSQVPA